MIYLYIEITEKLIKEAEFQDCIQDEADADNKKMIGHSKNPSIVSYYEYSEI